MAITAGVVGAVGSIGQGLMGAGAARSAASAEQNTLRQALGFQEGVYNTAQTNLNPWIQGGQSALQGVETFLGLPGGGGPAGSGALASYNQFTHTPFYTFPLRQATDTMNQQAAAKGLSLSTGQLGQLQQLGAGYASSNFQNYMNALTNLSGLGATTATNLGNIGVNVGQQVGQTSSGIAAAQGAGIMGSQGLINQGVGGALSALTGSGSSYGGTGSNGLIGALGGLFNGGGSGSLDAANPTINYGGTTYGTGGQSFPSFNPLQGN